MSIEKSNLPHYDPFQHLNERLDRIELAIERIIRSDTTPISQKKYLNVAEAADFIGLGVQSVYKLSSERKIPCLKRHKKLLFTREELSNWLESGRKAEVE